MGMQVKPQLLRVALVAALLARPLSDAEAKTLEVGPTHELKTPSAAAAIAAAGDVVEIEPGEYFDCAVWRVGPLTILGKGPGVVVTDKTCQAKGIFIIDGNDFIVRNITFARARVPDGNGAGIRFEGKNLTVEGSRFIDNESGILAATDSPNSTIRIVNSEFDRNGKCARSCAHALSVAQVLLLHVEQSKFTGTRGGHHVRSRALRTELVGNRIEDGPDGTSSYLVDIPNGGSLAMQGNRLEKGPGTTNSKAAVMIGEEDHLQPTIEFRLTNNLFINDSGQHTAFVLNWGDADAEVAGNQLQGSVTEVSSQGLWLHEIRSSLRGTKEWAVEAAKSVARRIQSW